jgi:hypothetical protein
LDANTTSLHDLLQNLHFSPVSLSWPVLAVIAFFVVTILVLNDWGRAARHWLTDPRGQLQRVKFRQGWIFGHKIIEPRTQPAPLVAKQDEEGWGVVEDIPWVELKTRELIVTALRRRKILFWACLCFVFWLLGHGEMTTGKGVAVGGASAAKVAVVGVANTPIPVLYVQIFELLALALAVFAFVRLAWQLFKEALYQFDAQFIDGAKVPGAPPSPSDMDDVDNQKALGRARDATAAEAQAALSGSALGGTPARAFQD